MRIVYYAHHHGSGHLRHARRIQALGLAEVTVVGPSGADVELAPDVDPEHPWHEPAGSPFHWTPRTETARLRAAQWHAVLNKVRPDVVMVDVSVEAAVLARLAGYAVVYRRMPGRREDAPHVLAYRTAERLFAYYPRELEGPAPALAERTRWLGMVSDAEPLPDDARVPGTVVVLSGAGGSGPDLSQLEAAARSTPGRTWHVLGPADGASEPTGAASTGPTRGSSRAPRGESAGRPGNLVLHGWVADPTAWLARAEVVVCGAGHNTVATVAGTRRPLVLAPEPRPHDEQLAFAESLRRVCGVPVVGSWEGADWPALLARPGDGELLASTVLTSTKVLAERTERMLREVVEDAGADVH